MLLEIAICISVYLIFLWLEVAPGILEQWRKQSDPRLHRLAVWVTPKLDLAYPFIVAAAITLPSMHQSSLGSLFLLAGPRLHPLWQSPILPGLFLLSCWFLGYGCVVMVSLLSSLVWKRPLHTPMLAKLSRVMAWVMLGFVAVRFADVAVRGVFSQALTFDLYGFMFWLEIGSLLTASLLILRGRKRMQPGSLMRLAMLSAFGGCLYRLDASLIAFMPGRNWSYFPSLIEMTIMFGFIAIAIMGYLVAVKRFPILPAAMPRA